MRAFDPWVGPHYQTEGLAGTKLMVLGESQYPGPEYAHLYPGGAPTPGCRSSIQENVRELVFENRNAFFTKITKLVLGQPAKKWVPQEARQDFWERVAFYNYIQWWLSAARSRPSEQNWIDALAPFLDVLAELRPDVLLVLGNELASRLPKIFPSEIEVVKIPHPSSKGFSYDPWTNLVRDAFERSKRMRGAP